MFSVLKLNARVTDSALQGTELCELLLNFLDVWLTPEIAPCSRIVLHNQNFRSLDTVPIKETLKCSPSQSHLCICRQHGEKNSAKQRALGLSVGYNSET